MVRRFYGERIRRMIYNGQPPDDANITVNLVNSYINDAVAAAAKASWQENIKIDNIAYLNNSFYTTFTGLSVVKDPTQGLFVYKITLPQIPNGLGKNEGVASLRFKDGVQATFDAIPLNANQIAYADNLRPIPNRIMYWSEGTFLYTKTSLNLLDLTAIVRMVSGGLDTDLDSMLNVPNEYFTFMDQYILKELLLEHAQKADQVADGVDAP